MSLGSIAIVIGIILLAAGAVLNKKWVLGTGVVVILVSGFLAVRA
jgi:hypothetical protein